MSLHRPFLFAVSLAALLQVVALGCSPAPDTDHRFAAAIAGMGTPERQDRLLAEHELRAGFPESLASLERAAERGSPAVARRARAILDDLGASDGSPSVLYFNGVRFDDSTGIRVDGEQGPEYVNVLQPEGLEIVYRLAALASGEFEIQIVLFHGAERSRLETFVGSHEAIGKRYPFLRDRLVARDGI